VSATSLTSILGGARQVVEGPPDTSGTGFSQVLIGYCVTEIGEYGALIDQFQVMLSIIGEAVFSKERKLFPKEL
jgi:hypothetical protein